MILAVDIGNSNIVLGLYKGDQLVSHHCISTQKKATCDEYAVLLKGLLCLDKIKGVVICSVVPSLLDKFQLLCEKVLHLQPLVLNSKVDTGLTINYENAGEVGADRIANGVGAYFFYKRGAIVVDLGTAVTFDLISNQGEYLGGAIAPGLEISAQALFEKADLLHPVSLEISDDIIGKNTTESIQSGIFYGFASMIEGMVSKLKKRVDFSPIVVLTGGWATKISKIINIEHQIQPFLTLEGLRIIYEQNH